MTRFFAIIAVVAASLAAPGVIGAQEPAATSSIARVAPSAQAAIGTTVRASASASSRSVTIGDYFYSPGELTAHVGDTVVWTNKGKVPEGHTVTGDGLDSGVLKQGDTFSHKFNQTGKFSYVCTLHPNMKGSVKVLARSSSSSGSDTDKGSSGDKNSAQGQKDSGGGGGSGGSGASGGNADTSAAQGGDAGSSAGGSSGSSDDGGSLPATGSDSLLLSLYGLVLIELGLVVGMISRPRRR